MLAKKNVLTKPHEVLSRRRRSKALGSLPGKLTATTTWRSFPSSFFFKHLHMWVYPKVKLATSSTSKSWILATSRKFNRYFNKYLWNAVCRKARCVRQLHWLWPSLFSLATCRLCPSVCFSPLLPQQFWVTVSSPVRPPPLAPLLSFLLIILASCTGPSDLKLGIKNWT